MKSLFFLLVFLIPLNLFSQLANTTYLIPSAGISIPANLSGYSASYNASVAVEFALSQITALGFETNYASNTIHPLDEGGPRVAFTSYQSYNGRLNTAGFLGYMKIQDASKEKTSAQLFIKFGIGFSMIYKSAMTERIKFGMAQSNDGESSNGFLFAPSLGVNFLSGGKDKIVLEAQYRMNRSSSQDVRMFIVNMGYAFRL